MYLVGSYYSETMPSCFLNRQIKGNAWKRLFFRRLAFKTVEFPFFHAFLIWERDTCRDQMFCTLQSDRTKNQEVANVRSCQITMLSAPCYCTFTFIFFLTLKRVTNRRPTTKKTEWHEFDQNSGKMSLTRAYECKDFFYCTFRQGSVRKPAYMVRGF